MADDTRRWLMTGTLALAGAAGGGVAGYMLAPDITGVVASLAVAGFGLGGALGTLFGGGWRSPKPPQPVATEPPPPEPPPPDPEPDPEPDPPEGGQPGWYDVPDGTRRYWNGDTWTTHVWRERRAKRR
jgi:hypothetical protein